MTPTVNGVRVQLTIGPPGTGKSVHTNQMLALERKYHGFTFIFDIGNSYESMVELYGGKVDRIGLDGPRVNPFALEPTEKNIKFLYNFVKMLLTNGGADLSPEDEDAVFKEVQGMYLIDRKIRRLRNLLLPKHLSRYLAKWIDKGVYNAIFDNVEDSLSLSRIQCWDFAGVSKDYPDLIEPLMIWLLRRIDDVVYDPKNLGVPKHVVIEEDLLEHEEQATAGGRPGQHQAGPQEPWRRHAHRPVRERSWRQRRQHRELLHVVPVAAGCHLQPRDLRRAVQDDRAAVEPLRESWAA